MLNSIQLMGRLTAEPEMKSSDEYLVSRFTLAVTRNYKNKDGERDTDFIRIVTWNSLAKIISEHFSKGQRVIIEGSLRTRPYTDKNGNKRTATEVVASNVYFVENKSPNEQIETVSDEYSAAESETFFEKMDADEDYPF